MGIVLLVALLALPAGAAEYFAPKVNQTSLVVINEVAWAGTSTTKTTDEWIELYNPTGTAVDLTGWHLQAVDGGPCGGGSVGLYG
jgi:hypothetical protein